MVNKQLNQLIEFHKAFGVPYREAYSEIPHPLSLIELRYNLMNEEAEEWIEAAAFEHSKQKRAKELADLLYTVLGTIITEGLQDVIERVFDAVHESNMSKLGEDGKPIRREDGKVLKGPNYKEPNLDFL
jgi:predicted HAD superfamily Cof-like phosphohydrolase